MQTIESHLPSTRGIVANVRAAVVPTLLAVAAFAVIPASSAHADRYDAWVFADQPTVASYDVYGGPTTTSRAAPTRMTRMSAGRYTARFPGLATWDTTSSYKGIALAMAVGSDDTRCGTENWWREGADMVVEVLCVRATVPIAIDSAVLIRFVHLKAPTVYGGAYVVATHPSQPIGYFDYAQPRAFNGRDTSTTGTSVRRSGTGSYIVRFNGDHRRNNPYNPNINANPTPSVGAGLSGNGTHCNTWGIVALAAFTEVMVQCWDPYGSPANANFAVLLDDSQSIGFQSGGRVAGESSVSSGYDMALTAFTSPGQYDILFPAFRTPVAGRSTWAFPTAGHTGASHFCKLDSFGGANLNSCSSVANHGVYADVSCYTTTGARVTPNTVSIVANGVAAQACY